MWLNHRFNQGYLHSKTRPADNALPPSYIAGNPTTGPPLPVEAAVRATKPMLIEFEYEVLSSSARQSRTFAPSHSLQAQPLRQEIPCPIKNRP
jgi:hypothetical protein